MAFPLPVEQFIFKHFFFEDALVIWRRSQTDNRSLVHPLPIHLDGEESKRLALGCLFLFHCCDCFYIVYSCNFLSFRLLSYSGAKIAFFLLKTLYLFCWLLILFCFMADMMHFFLLSACCRVYVLHFIYGLLDLC